MTWRHVCAECLLSVLLGLEEAVQTIGWVQGYVGHFYEDLGGGGSGDGDGVEGRGAQEARHEGFHCFDSHYLLGLQ